MGKSKTLSLASRTAVKRDVTLVLLFNLLMLILFSQIDLFEKIYAYSIEHELDEIILLFITLSISLTLFLYRRWQEEKTLKAKLLSMATHDGLTGMYNRRGIDSILEEELERSKRTGSFFSVVMVDLDDLKIINDSYGHDTGDSVLQQLASVLSSSTRGSDKVARWGGDEFLILCPDTDKDGATCIANKLTKNVGEYLFNTIGRCTVSIGTATLQENDTVDSLFTRADNYMYQAKENGKKNISGAESSRQSANI